MSRTMPIRASAASALTVFAALNVVGCGDGSAGPPLPNGVYVVEGSATLATNHETTREVEAHERFVLYVEDDRPSYFREESFGDYFGRLYDLSFAEGAETSDPVQLGAATGSCTVRVRRDGCADFDFDGCVRLDLRTDAGFSLTGRWSACPTDEVAVRRLAVVGAIESTAITPDGAAQLAANYRLDPSVDAIEVRVNGMPREVSWTPDADADTAALDLGPVPPNAELTIRYTGTRADVDFDHVTPFATTAAVELPLTTLVEGSFDARGEQAVTFADGTFEAARESNPPLRSFAFALALGAIPEGTNSLTLSLVSTGFGMEPTQVFLVRADGAFERMTSGSVSVPDGAGDAWLIVANPGSFAFGAVGIGGRLTIGDLAWE
ncbi:MAG: hypothetical protein MUE69_17600 [Myxococcota bacterium]|jgi:hypothetical protein|nr:hypothetical protein [Myxococcota bacterium]